MAEPGRQGKLSAAQRARLDAVFGEVLPAATSDERGLSPKGQQADETSEKWLRENKPPHHG